MKTAIFYMEFYWIIDGIPQMARHILSLSTRRAIRILIATHPLLFVISVVASRHVYSWYRAIAFRASVIILQHFSPLEHTPWCEKKRERNGWTNEWMNEIGKKTSMLYILYMLLYSYVNGYHLKTTYIGISVDPGEGRALSHLERALESNRTYARSR